MPPDQGMPPTGGEMPPAETPPAETPPTQTPYEARLLEVMADQGKLESKLSHNKTMPYLKGLTQMEMGQ